MRKRLIAIAMVLIMMMSFTACGGQGAQEKDADADAIICAYHPYGDAHDADGNGPFNLNLAVGLSSVFGQSVPQGKLPVNVPKIEFEEDGTPSFTDEVLFERGFGLENWSEKQ